MRGRRRRLASDVTIEALAGAGRRHRRERWIANAFWAAAALSIAISALILLSLTGEALRFVRLVDPSSLWAQGWFPRRGLFDLRTIIVGTLLVSGVAMLVAAPVGLGAAMYLSEYAGRRARSTLKPVLEILAGIPSVVLGFFALAFISPELIQRFAPGTPRFNVLSAGIGVGILTIPLVASIAEDAMHAVPRSLREAAAGLGARRRTATLRVVVPAAISGIAASLILGLSRAIGETMVVAIAAGATGGSLFSMDVLQPGQTMTAAMAALAVGSDQVSVRGGSPAVSSLSFVGLLLFLMTFALNLASERFVRKRRRVA